MAVVESGPGGGQKIYLTEEGRKFAENYYASLPTDQAKALRENLEREVGRLLDMTPEALFREAYMIAAGMKKPEVATGARPSADSLLSRARQRISGILKR